jgi:hypothetical protein
MSYGRGERGAVQLISRQSVARLSSAVPQAQEVRHEEVSYDDAPTNRLRDICPDHVSAQVRANQDYEFVSKHKPLPYHLRRLLPPPNVDNSLKSSILREAWAASQSDRDAAVNRLYPDTPSLDWPIGGHQQREKSGHPRETRVGRILRDTWEEVTHDEVGTAMETTPSISKRLRLPTPTDPASTSSKPSSSLPRAAMSGTPTADVPRSRLSCSTESNSDSGER